MAEKECGQAEELLSISEVAELLGVAPSALRYYERKGLVKPQRSTFSNYRGYGVMELLELTDVIHFRNAGLAVNDLPTLFTSPIISTLDLIDQGIDKTLEELEDLRLRLSSATRLAKKIRRRLSLGVTGQILGTTPAFTHLSHFPVTAREFLAEYLNRQDELVYVALIPDPSKPGEYVDCACTDPATADNTSWEAKKNTRYVEFMLTTDYGETGKNDLAAWRDRFAAEGIRIGCVVAEYLTYDIDPKTGRRIDCYDAWAEIL